MKNLQNKTMIEKAIRKLSTMMLLFALGIPGAFCADTAPETVTWTGEKYTLTISGIKYDYEMEKMSEPYQGSWYSVMGMLYFKADYEGEYPYLQMYTRSILGSDPNRYTLLCTNIPVVDGKATYTFSQKFYRSHTRFVFKCHDEERVFYSLGEINLMDYIAPEDRELLLYDWEKTPTAISHVPSELPSIVMTQDRIVMKGFDNPVANARLTDLNGITVEVPVMIASDSDCYIPLASIPKGFYILFLETKNHKPSAYKIIIK